MNELNISNNKEIKYNQIKWTNESLAGCKGLNLKLFTLGRYMSD